MNTFIIAALAISALTLIVIVWPLLRNRAPVSYERQAQNIHFAQERLAELEAQLNNASISASDYEALKLEIENTLADDIDLQQRTAQATAPAAKAESNKLLITFLVIMLPLAALSSYWVLGTPNIFSAAQLAAPSNSQDVEKLIASVEQRLATSPDDVQGWRVLSRTYLATGQYVKAKQGFLRVLELEGDSADTLVSIADAAALAAGGDLSGEASEYLERALVLQPNHPQALWLAGLSAAQLGQLESAREHWQRLLPLLANQPQQQQELQEIINETLPGSSLELNSTASAETATPIASQNTPNGAATSLRVRVSLADALLEQVAADDLVFVIARAQNGPAAPLAVKRLRVSDLPTTVELSDADAMLEQFKLSLFEQVLVSARVAKSGNPVAQAGDLESASVASSNQNSAVLELRISNIVEP